MAEEYAMTDEDKESGLESFLYEARDTAAKAVGNLFSEIGIDSNQFQFIEEIPIGLEEDSDMAGVYDPGIYGIVVGRDSDEIEEFYDSEGDERQKVRNRLSVSLAHEMIHSIQTTPSNYLEDGYDTVGNTVMGWKGLEEGMAEALGNIAMKMYLKNTNLKETAQDLEEACAKRDMPATQLAAKLIDKMGTDTLKWYIICAQTGEYRSNNQIQQLFGSSYNTFCKNMTVLYDCEIYGNLDNNKKQSLLNQTSDIIDKI